MEILRQENDAPSRHHAVACPQAREQGVKRPGRGAEDDARSHSCSHDVLGRQVAVVDEANQKAHSPTQQQMTLERRRH
jgi:hypothetical protein